MGSWKYLIITNGLKKKKKKRKKPKTEKIPIIFLLKYQSMYRDDDEKEYRKMKLK